MATHSSNFAWRIPWTEKPGGLQSTGSQSWTRLSNFTHTHTHTRPFLLSHCLSILPFYLFSHLPPSLFYKRIWYPASRKIAILRYHSSIFSFSWLSKVIFLAPIPWVSDSCGEHSELGLGNTSIVTSAPHD